MNRLRYRLVYSSVRGIWMPVPEAARGHVKSALRKPRRGRASRTGAAALLALGYLTAPALAPAQAPLPKGTLPVPASNFVGSGNATAAQSGATLTVNQTTAKTILNWNSFNISSDAAVRFRQPNAASAALNRIHDANPSVIEGRLSANGQIYLINQNGIIFAKGAQVDANTIVASALNISDQRFLNGLLTDTAPLEATVPDGFIRVAEGASLVSAREGRIMLLAPEVSNRGVIESRDGQIILAAGQKVFLSASQSPALRGLLVEVDGAGSSSNLDLGKLIVEHGNATLAGLAVNQSGRISATTSVVANGSVRLVARGASGGGQVVLGKDSRIEILPDASSTTIQDAQRFTASSVEIVGKTVELRENATIRAPGGNVTISAQKGNAATDTPQNDVRIYMAAGSSIDVSGVKGVPVPIERNVLKVELRGDELKDSPLQRTSVLRGKTVYVDARVGTPLADVSSYQAQIGRTAQEKLAVGGTVQLHSEGDVVLRDGSRVDVSGGSIRYLDGYVRTTKLLSQGRIYDIGEASPDLIYQGVADSYTLTSAKWGVSQTWLAPAQFTPGYVEGKDAGTFGIATHAVVLDGRLVGSTISGPLQRVLANLPKGGELVLGNSSGGSTTPANYWLGDVRFEASPPLLDRLFGFGDPSNPSPLPADRHDSAYVPTGIFRSGGFARVRVVTNGAALIPEGEVVALGPGGQFAVTAREIDVRGGVFAPGGSISLTTRDTLSGSSSTPSDYDIVVAADARLSTAGTWVNDRPQAGGTGIGAILRDGGQVALTSFTDLTLAAGSVIDVTGGGWLDSHGKLSAGNGGTITLRTGRFRTGSADAQTSVLTLGGTLLGHALGTGGTLELSTSRVAFGSVPSAPGLLQLTPDFLQRGGFQHYTIAGTDGVTVASGETLAPLTKSLVPRALNPGLRFVDAPTGSNIRSFTDVALLPDELLQPTSLDLVASSQFHGSILVDEQASISVGPAGSITLTGARQLTVLGSLAAPGGNIALATPKPTQFNDPFFADQSIWLGPDSRLDTSGVSRVFLQPDGLLHGDVLAGGSVSIQAGKGYLVMREGAVIDVSGASAVVDIPFASGLGRAYDRRAVGSAGGSITLAAREGMLLDGSFLAQGAAGARGGDLALSYVGYSSTLLIPQAGNFPAAQRRFVLAGSRASLPADTQAAIDRLRPGDVIDAQYASPGKTTLNGRTFVFADRINTTASGIDSVVLRGPDSGEELGRAEVVGTTAFQLNRSIEVDVPTLAGGAGSSLLLQAARVALANRDSRLQADQSVENGSAALEVRADAIDVVGKVALTGFGAVRLDSRGDIRGMGVLQGARDLALVAGVRTAGNVTLRAAQVYPTTLTDFSIDVKAGPARAIVVESSGGAPAPVLSAGGTLTLRASSIKQGGTLKAPFGSIVLDADQAITLQAGSLTSTSGLIDGPGGPVAIPFGITQQNQRDYVYPLDDTRQVAVTAPPEKQVVLQAASVTIEAGPESDPRRAAKIDVSGGGDLYAYEFVPGPGGSRDVLDPANSPGLYAIIPWLPGGNAPYDHLYYDGVAGLSAGAAVQLTGVDGLAAGVYALMPARYAVVPGAYLVRQVGGTTDFLPLQAHRLSDGTQVVAGKLATPNRGGSYTLDTRSSAFEVVAGTIAGTRSEYLQTYASTFFVDTPAAQRPGDAGRLAIARAQSLTVGAPNRAPWLPWDDDFGNLVAEHADGFRGAELDVAIDKLAVVSGTQTGGAGFVDLNVNALRSLGVSSLSLSPATAPQTGNHAAVSSLLLGGTRKRVDGTVEIDVTSREVKVLTTEVAPLAAEEVLLAASDFVTITGKSVVGARAGGAGTRASVYRFVNTLTSGDDSGAFVRVANAGLPALARGSSSRSAGSITAGADTTLIGTSITLDATLSNSVDGGLALGAGGALALGAGLISLGDVTLVDTGLKLGGDALAQLSKLEHLLLRSYSSIDLYGAAVFGREQLTVTLEAGAMRGFANAGKTSRITAAALSLGNANGVTPGATPVLADQSTAVAGTGSLEVKAGTIVLGPGSGDIGVAVTGFSDVTLNAKDVVAAGKGKLDIDGALAVSSARLSAQKAAEYSITATGRLSTVASGSVTGLGAAGQGAVLTLSGASVDHAGVIDAPSGTVVIEATGTTGVRALLPPAGGWVAGATYSGLMAADGGGMKIDVQVDAAGHPRARVVDPGKGYRNGKKVTFSLGGGDTIVATVDVGDVDLLKDSVVRTAGVDMPFRDVTAATPGGSIDLRSAFANVHVDGLADAGGPDAAHLGNVRVETPHGSLAIESNGRLIGGAFGLDALTLGDAVKVGEVTLGAFTILNNALNAGGFGAERSIHVVSGNIEVASTDVVKARVLRWSADDGNIIVAGKLDASGPKGGDIAVFARHGASAGTGNIVVETGARIDASATEPASSGAGSLGDGGKVLLAISDVQTGSDTAARIDIQSGSTIDVSGVGAGTGGTLSLRVPRLSSSSQPVAITHLGATVKGAREILVEPFKVYTASTIGPGSASGNFDSAVTGVPFTETNAYFTASKKADILKLLGSDPRLHLRPGIEIRSDGNLKLSADWNLCGTAATCATNAWRFQGEPGVLTLRAGGDVIFDGSLSDGFSGTTVAAGVLRNVASWSYRIVAGADLSRTDVLAVKPADARGDFKLAAGKLVRTGTGDIDVAAARDIVLTDGASVIYTAGVPTDPPAGFVRIPTNVDGSGIGTSARTAMFPDGGGDLSLAAGRDIVAVASGQFITDWLYRYAQRDTGAETVVLRANPQASWWPRYVDFRQGVATLGGGDIDVRAGRDITNLGVMAPTNGRVGGDLNTAIDPNDPQALSLLKLQGGGDVSVTSGRDILGGFVLVDQGQAVVSAGRNVRAAQTGVGLAPPMHLVLALGASSADVFARGNLDVQSVVDATALPQLETFEQAFGTFFHRYQVDSSVTLRSGTGDITLFNNADSTISRNINQMGADSDALVTYPGSLRAIAFGGDIGVQSLFELFPVARSAFELLAAGSVDFASDVRMLQSRQSDFASVLAPRMAYAVEGILPTVPVYQNDPDPVRVYALSGSISAGNGRVVLAKQGWFAAGTDILDLAVEGQNLHATDITRYEAGGDIRFETKRDPNSGQLLLNSDTLHVDGPGRVELIAGGTVDLGNSIGVVSSGNINNSTLPEGGASILVLAGFPEQPRYAQFIEQYIAADAPKAQEYAGALVSYMHGLTGQSYGAEEARTAFGALPLDLQAPFVRDVFFSELKASGRGFAAGGGVQAYERGYHAIEVLFPAEALSSERHEINLFFSQIKTEQGGGIDLINASGMVNAGLATSGEGAKTPAEQGIVTVRGGSIRGFVKDDFLVNQSRVFTLGGGDILLWSSEGDIDAGRGKKTATATPPPLLIIDQNGQVKLDVSNSIAGSGIGVLLGREGIVPGDVDLIAPKGEVNAGDAGIRSAGNLTIAALRVRGAENIQVGGVATGVPAASSSVGAGLAGAGNVAAEAAKSAERVTQDLAANAAAQQQAGSLVPSFITVEVIGFGEEGGKDQPGSK